MKTLYEASHALEAHMLSAMLRQHGISTVVLGEHLQGALGELPAGTLVRLVVDEAQYPAAREVIAQWEAQQPADDGPRGLHRTSSRAPAGAVRVLAAFLAGLLLGAALMAGLMRPASAGGVLGPGVVRSVA
jgi:Putative prokaryotic signal transducing protein